MPGLDLQAHAFTTPGIKGLLDKRPDIKARVARVVAVSALRIQSGAKRKAPVAPRHGGRLKLSINTRRLDNDGLVVVIGTNVRAKPTATYPEGYGYPARMEFDTTLTHTTGEWGYLRKSLMAEKPKFGDQCQRALVRGLKGYE